MGRYTFRLPDIGEGIAEAEIVAWHVAVGDVVAEDGRLADMMTDKATVEMESPVSGVVRELAGAVGARVAIGAPLVVIETEGEEGEADTETPPPTREILAVSPSRAVKPVPFVATEGKVLAAPPVRARARALGIDLSQVPAGADGVIRHADLDAVLIAGKTAPAEAARAVEILSGAGEQVKVIGLRRRIAENMASSKRHIPHFTYVEECDVTALEALRADLNDGLGDAPRLTILPFLIAAICRALPEFPMINARYDDAGGVVTRYASVHLGMATQTPGGLMVPVIRDAQALGLRALAAEIARLAQAAREGSATAGELSGSTLTVTSLGALGGIASTPVINRPEVAIIGPNRVIERPVFMPDGQIAPRKLMNLSISCDHRVVDGWDAASFVQAVKRLVEAPLQLLAG